MAASRRGRGKISIVLPDMHFPHHHVPSMRTCLQAIKEIRPDEVCLTGDVLDCSHWTRHPKWALSEHARHSYLNDEIAPFQAYAAEIRRWAGSIVWVFGNHDAWPERLLASEFNFELGSDLSSLITPSALMKSHIDRMVPYTETGIPRYEIAPNLWLVHGWSHAKHAAYQHLQLARNVSVVHGHTHRIQSYTERLPSDDSYVTAWSPGCLCEYQPMWLHGKPTTWARGFSVIYHSKRDPTDWTENTCRIRADGKAILDGGKAVRPEYLWR